MVIIVEKNQEKRRSLHQLFESCLLPNQLITVGDKEQLLLAVERVKVTSVWLSHSDESLLDELRKIPGLNATPVYIMAASSMEVHPLLLRRYRAKTVLTPLQSYQIRHLTGQSSSSAIIDN